MGSEYQTEPAGEEGSPAHILRHELTQAPTASRDSRGRGPATHPGTEASHAGGLPEERQLMVTVRLEPSRPNDKALSTKNKHRESRTFKKSQKVLAVSDPRRQ